MENEPHDTLSIELEKLGVELDRIPDPREFVEQSAAAILKQVGKFPSATREAAALERLRKYFATCGEFLRRFVYEPLPAEVNSLSRDLRALAVPEPSARPGTEIDRVQRQLLQLGYLSIELDAVRTALKEGERITGVTARAVTTSERTIDRFGLRKIRPRAIREQQYIDRWNSQFPTAEMITEQARRAEAPPRPIWSPE
jgi:hypothetical protein